MPLTIKVYEKSSMSFRMLKIGFDMTCAAVCQLCCEKYGLLGFEQAFQLYEWRLQGGVPAERRIAPNEVIANIVKVWETSGLAPDTARFVFSLDERAQRDLLARATVLQPASHQSLYAKVQPPPDISGLMQALSFYFGNLETETTEELLRPRPDGTYLVRDGAQPDVVTLSYVFRGGVYHLQVKFDIHGFFMDDSGARQLTIEEVVQVACSRQYPLYSPLSTSQAPPQTMLNNSIRINPCYYAGITSAHAEELLRGQREQTFLIRPSSREGCFATSYVHQGRVKHSLIVVAANGLSTPGDARTFPSLTNFIDSSRMMFIGLPRSNASIDDRLLSQLGVREAHPQELQMSLSQKQARWQQGDQ